MTMTGAVNWLAAPIRALTNSPTIPHRRPRGFRGWALLSRHLVCHPIRRLRACSLCGADKKVVLANQEEKEDAMLDFEIMECSSCRWWDALPERWDT